MQSIPEVELNRLSNWEPVMLSSSTPLSSGDLLVLNGDVPLLRPETLKQLLRTHQSIKTPPQFSQHNCPILKWAGIL